MTRLSSYLLPTEKQAPADAEAVSHKLMVRAGLVRQLGAGLWTWMPAGWRVHRRVLAILREEMDAIGAQELSMPVLQPAELWRRTGRYPIEELFKLQDRKGADMVLAMTHEEVVTTHVAQVVRSYRDLPLILYHTQVKERDEPRPRAGVLRTREFVMKDSYSFDRDEESLAESYEKHVGAYDRIFDRCGLEWYRVESDVGMMGGAGAHEYMAPCAAGEDEVALAPGYAANLEVASADPQPVTLPGPLDAPQEVHTPGLTSVDEVAGNLGVPAGALLKAYPVIADGRGLVLVVVRGDHRVNEIKLRNVLGAPVRPAQPDEFAQKIGPAGFIGPVGANAPVLLDAAVADGGYVTGANRPDFHLRGVEPGRDFAFERVDMRTVEAGDTVNGQVIRIEAAIEVGNIFKLGTRYSEALGAMYLDESGTSRPIVMGCYGIGPARIVAAAVEQTADEAGIAWPRALAPFDVELVGLGRAGSEEQAYADTLYDELRARGADVLYDDRELAPGQKFADAELLGCPLRITVGKRTLSGGELELQVRRGRETRSVALDGAAEAVLELWRTLP
jgi:prolyl-tRNA synthetase